MGSRKMCLLIEDENEEELCAGFSNFWLMTGVQRYKCTNHKIANGHPIPNLICDRVTISVSSF